ncbi:MAG: anchor protein [Phycisphaerales bacterium]|nr:anchor protein [Phycisphaerales bacterium]
MASIKCAIGPSALVAAAVGIMAGAAAAAPIVEYRFDASDGSTPPLSASTGTDATPIRIQSPAVVGAAGSGVSGQVGDRAFANATVTGSSPVTGGRADHAADDNAIDALASFTISVWLRSPTAVALSSGRIMENVSGTAGQLIQFSSVGNVQLQVNGNAAGNLADSGNFYSATQTWMFFAVTYDGTATANNVKFYRGFRNAAEAGGGSPSVALVNTLSINQGAVGSENVALNVFNRSANDRTLVATADNFRIDGTQTAGNAAGALTLAQLEAYRAADVVPEPAVGGALATAAVGLLARRWRAAR